MNGIYNKMFNLYSKKRENCNSITRIIVALFQLSNYLKVTLFFRSDTAGVATLVDPFDLSLKQLRWLLQARGISSYGAIEKKDLSDIVSASGLVTTVSIL